MPYLNPRRLTPGMGHITGRQKNPRISATFEEGTMSKLTEMAEERGVSTACVIRGLVKLALE
uniref:hypothetical protein n=1 Tax=Pelagimonas sp. TaxID=2073170 RepID=UPI003D6A05B9